MSNLLGKPINGDVQHNTRSRHLEQHEPLELMKRLDALVELEEVASVRWEQYTPYFNDGDPCYFRLGEARVKFAEYNEDEDDEGDYGDGYLSDYEIDSHTKVYDLLISLNREIDHHVLILQDKFGDPAAVSYNGENFTVEHYDHD